MAYFSCNFLMSSSEFGRLPTKAVLYKLDSIDKEKLSYTSKEDVDELGVVILSYLSHIDRKVDKLYKLLLDAEEGDFSDEELADSPVGDLVPSSYQASVLASGPSGRPLKRSRADFGPFPSFGPTDLPKNNPYFKE